MKLTRGVSGDRVIRALPHVGYSVIRQKAPAHTITVPLHDPLKTGTLHGILAEVTSMRSIPVESLAVLL